MKIIPSNKKEVKLIKSGKLGKAMGPNPNEDKRIKTKNVFNPENIKAGDYVKISNPDSRDPRKIMKVESVGGTNGNKVFCKEIGHELYANCFKKVIKPTKKKNKSSKLLCREH